METKDISADVKSEMSKSIERLAKLRDEAKLHLHLATLDARQEWDDKLEPMITELQSSAAQLGESSKEKFHEVMKNVEAFVAKLRGRSSAS